MNLIITSNGKRRDFGLLVISGGINDGKRAISLRQHALFLEMQRLGVPGINASMGKAALLLAFYNEVERVAGPQLQPPNAKRPRPLDAVIARQASELINRGLADSTPDAVNPAPAAPIASTSTRG